ncbi:MAG: hypothetical protein RIC55_03395 [Pirellulaceae bacterium]
MTAGDLFQNDPVGGEGMPNWMRVLTALPHFPKHLRQAAAADAEEYGEHSTMV